MRRRDAMRASSAANRSPDPARARSPASALGVLARTRSVLPLLPAPPLGVEETRPRRRLPLLPPPPGPDRRTPLRSARRTVPVISPVPFIPNGRVVSRQAAPASRNGRGGQSRHGPFGEMGSAADELRALAEKLHGRGYWPAEVSSVPRLTMRRSVLVKSPLRRSAPEGVPRMTAKTPAFCMRHSK